MPDDYFDDGVARRYDEAEAEMFAAGVVEPAADFLAEHADSGAALEMGIGTGRIAVPLSKRGIPVHGIDLSEAMIGQLRAKPDGGEISVTVGDFATTRVPGSFSLVYLVFNTIMNLTSADEQVACFQNAAAHLTEGGRFVVEVGVPQLQRLPPGETVRAFEISEALLGFDEYDIASQRLVSHHYSMVDGKFELRSTPFRYVWPSELDLMARLANMKLRERWSGWRREPFTSESTQHVSVWEKTEPPTQL
jgi:methyltransferase family protein